jgi:hypothetical protein
MMTIPAKDQKFEDALKIFEMQAGEATQFWYAASAMSEVANVSPATLNALNFTPTFWITARAAMEYQAIASVGKVFGPRKRNPYNIDSLFQVLSETLSVFSRESLIARRRRMSANAAEWLPQFMEHVHVPSSDDIRALQRVSRPHRRVYETQWKQVRDEHVAHSATVDSRSRWEMFQKTRIGDLEELIGFLNQLHAALWQMYYDGRRPILEVLPTCSVRDLVATKLGDLRQSRTQENIVAETRKCMFLITEAVKAFPPGYKRSGSWRDSELDRDKA